MKQTLAVLFGGCSSEYGVSLHSAAAVIQAVDRQRYELLCIGITKTGQWLLYGGGVEELEADTWWQHPSCVPALVSPSREDHGVWLLYPDRTEKRALDVVFPVLHGKNGEDGTVQGLLQLAGIPCAGCGCLTSALCLDKDLAHRLARQAGIDCPHFATLYREEGETAALAEQVRKEMAGYQYPWFVKPATEGSSFGITRVTDDAQLIPALELAFGYTNKVVVEEGAEGIEVGCAVLGNRSPIAGTPDGVSLQGGFFDYHEKYNLETAKLVLPAPIPPELRAGVQQAALELFRLFECRGFARLDFFVTPDGRILFNEINTIPGFTAHSRYPGMMANIGVSFPQLVQRVLDLALEEV